MLLKYYKYITGILLLLTACGGGSGAGSNGTNNPPDNSPDSSSSIQTIDFTFKTRDWTAISGALTVNCTSGDFSKIQDAIDSATDGDTIHVCEGNYNETLLTHKSLTFEGYGNAIITGNASATEPLITIAQDPDATNPPDVTVSFNYFWFTNNSNIFSYLNTHLTISNSTFSDFDTPVDYSGGGIIFAYGENNDLNTSTVTINNTDFYNNICRGMDGCLEFYRVTVVIQDSIIGANTAYPSIVFIHGSEASISNTAFKFNQTDGDSPYDKYDGTYGGALYIDSNSDVTLSNTDFTSNNGDDASAIFIFDSSVAADNCSFSRNTASTLNGTTNALDLHGTIFLVTNYFGVKLDSFFSSKNSTWDSNNPYDVVIRDDSTSSTFTATSGNFECHSEMANCE